MNFNEWLNKNNAPSISYLTDKTLKYINNKDWYLKSNKLIKKYFPDNYNMFIDILSITSPRTTVKNNCLNAIRTIDKILNHKPIDIIYGIANKPIKRNLELYMKEKKFNGIKINQFASSLRLINGSICIDVWVLKAFNLKRLAPTKNDIKHINHVVKLIAKRLKLKTYEVQASLWSYAKNELNNTGFKDYKDFSFYLKQYFNQRTLDNFMEV